jgi:hypothetical protein
LALARHQLGVIVDSDERNFVPTQHLADELPDAAIADDDHAPRPHIGRRCQRRQCRLVRRLPWTQLGADKPEQRQHEHGEGHDDHDLSAKRSRHDPARNRRPNHHESEFAARREHQGDLAGQP